jgi:hypothetical protein
MKQSTETIILVLAISIAILIVPIVTIAGTPKPEILILSEKFVEGYNGETLLFVDYTVGGIATNATFRAHQMEKYNKLIDHLEKTGRVSR